MNCLSNATSLSNVGRAQADYSLSHFSHSNVTPVVAKFTLHTSETSWYLPLEKLLHVALVRKRKTNSRETEIQLIFRN